MRYTTLGHTGLRVSAVGLGCSRLGSTTNNSSIDEQKLFLGRAYMDGVNHFDTANIYGQGESERLIGLVFREHRHTIVVATKAGQRYSGRQGLAIRVRRPLRFLAARSPWLAKRIGKARAVTLTKDFEPDYLLLELQSSCRRLATDYVDIFYLHSPSIDDLRSAKLSGFMVSLKAKGLIRAWGVSCDGDVDVEAILSHVNPDVLQLSNESASCSRNRQALQRFVGEGGAVITRGILAQAKSSNGSERSDVEVERAWAAACGPPFVSAVLCGTGNIDHLRVACRGVESREAASEHGLR